MLIPYSRIKYFLYCYPYLQFSLRKRDGNIRLNFCCWYRWLFANVILGVNYAVMTSSCFCFFLNSYCNSVPSPECTNRPFFIFSLPLIDSSFLWLTISITTMFNLFLWNIVSHLHCLGSFMPFYTPNFSCFWVWLSFHLFLCFCLHSCTGFACSLNSSM